MIRGAKVILESCGKTRQYKKYYQDSNPVVSWIERLGNTHLGHAYKGSPTLMILKWSELCQPNNA